MRYSSTSCLVLEYQTTGTKKDTGWRIHPTELFDFVHQLISSILNNPLPYPSPLERGYLFHLWITAI